MRVFITGASGHIGSAVASELLLAGHEVIGLARSESSAAAIEALGAEVRRGGLEKPEDLDGLHEAAADADAVIHLAFNHDAVAAGDMAGAATADLAVVHALGDALEGTGKTLMGVGFASTGIEKVDKVLEANPRFVVAQTVAGLADRGVRPLLVGIPPVVHSTQDKRGFMPTLIGIARATGVSGYVDDGANRWPAAHTLDVARLFRLVLEQAPVGEQLVAASEAGITVREIAETIGRHLGVPVESIPADQAATYFKSFSLFMSIDLTLSSVHTQQLLGWKPEHPGLIADLDEGHYFATT
jgi:nucleoside-diphosphate-sugar epimerase